MKKQWSRLQFGIITLIIASTSAAKDADNWHFNITPYAWFTTIEGDMSTGSIEVDPDEILSSLDFGLLLSGEVRKKKWLATADIVYLKASDGETVAYPDGGGGTFPLQADLEVENWIVDAFGGRNIIQSDRLLLDVVAGVRYFYMKNDLKVNAAAPPISEQLSEKSTLWNGVVGLRGQVELGHHWFVPYHLDIGTGDANFTWQGLAGIGYSWNWIELIAAYQYLSFDLDEPGVDSLTIHGPEIGLSFWF